MGQTASFCFFNSLNDFLPNDRKDTLVNYVFTGTPAVKDAIEAIGVPHAEVDVIVVNELPVDFFYRLQANDTVKVYPAIANALLLKKYSLTPRYVYPLKFIADVQLGKLMTELRMLGINTLYQNDYTDKLIVEIAEKENRIVLTRSVGLLKYKAMKWGYWLRSQITEKQLGDILYHYNLLPSIQPFTRCLLCNGEIEAVAKEDVLEHLPPKAIEFFNEFFQCSSCKKIYWKGSHYKNMMRIIERIGDNFSPQQ